MLENKKCSKCKKVKGVSNFYASSTQPSGLQSNCKDCNRIEAREAYRHGDKNKQKISSRRTMLKSKYGISLEQYNEMLQTQNEVCAICGLPETVISNKKGGVDSLRVDHCHSTGQIRGLLCSKCNFGVGNFNDSLYLLSSALNYILKYKQQNDKTN